MQQGRIVIVKSLPVMHACVGGVPCRLAMPQKLEIRGQFISWSSLSCSLVIARQWLSCSSVVAES